MVGSNLAWKAYEGKKGLTPRTEKAKTSELQV